MSGLLLGTIKKPTKTDATFNQWEINNCTVLGWLFNSMETQIYNMFMYHDTVDSLWAALKKTYGHARNDSRIYELYKDIAQATQGTQSVTDYFGFLQARWEELAHYEPLSELPKDAATIVVGRLQRQQTYAFLMGLRSNLFVFKS
ncbi:hypothetical protein QJS04_geneDACA014974 [Acorus gramineus]|uniref:Retrotransposon gag domain-containing protein n=1 Tax=Acorus gramineus TaxID=55184 RepID=A0AAV9AP25_ACOGR|nr:hypothetical protein QJS04_geneDACA014974 [Acorus gramineus]